MFRLVASLLLLILLLTGCIVNDTLPALELLPEAAGSVVIIEEPTAESPVSEVSPSAPSATLPSMPISTVTEGEAEERSPVASSVQPPLSPEHEVAQLLSSILPPARDDYQLANAYRGLAEGLEEINEQNMKRPEVGARQKFKILNVVNNTVGEIEAELQAISNHAYFWFDIGPGSTQPGQEELQDSVTKFDDIYNTVVRYFGSEHNPGIDGDPRLHVVNASPIALCGVTEETLGQCPLAGLVQPADLLPSYVDPRSNEREMFVMNGQRFGSAYYLGVLAHEFRHMIEDNYDRADTDWEKEGSATLAAQLAGYPSGGIERGNLFLANPDQQLNSWSEDNTGPYYGQGYILNRYIFDRLGENIYREFATSPLPGLQALGSVADENDLNVDGESLWLDWLVALVIHDDPSAPEKYRFTSDGLNTAALISISSIPSIQSASVKQYAADYYEIPIDAGDLTFSGATEVSLLETTPISGERFWFAQRGNNSNPRLTREVDLTEVDHATLNYHVFADIEYGYDFAYVSVSVDGGQVWMPLAGENMQGLETADNPAGSAFAERFYTGRNREWIEEKIDLSPYAGSDILLRFEYVTDPILTYGGLALDDITIPEIDFMDDVESEEAAWEAEGFIRATTTIPQRWHLQLIALGEGGLNVEELLVDQNGYLSFNLDKYGTNEKLILIVAASAPTTLTPAEYELNINP
jgi:immune inhibitor A